jgi:hypothetical protein
MGRTKGSRNKPKDPTAAKPKRGRKAEAQAKPSQSSADGSKKPASDQVVWLVNELENIDNKKGLFSASAKEIVDNAVENKHFDKKALAMVRSLKKLADKDPEAFAITLPHLLSYIDDLGLDKLADESREFALDDEKPPRISNADLEVVHSDAA